ncbi:hypothetical protein D3C86_2067240 [compost metagenome]
MASGHRGGPARSEAIAQGLERQAVEHLARLDPALAGDAHAEAGVAQAVDRVGVRVDGDGDAARESAP